MLNLALCTFLCTVLSGSQALHELFGPIHAGGSEVLPGMRVEVNFDESAEEPTSKDQATFIEDTARSGDRVQGPGNLQRPYPGPQSSQPAGIGQRVVSFFRNVFNRDRGPGEHELRRPSFDHPPGNRPSSQDPSPTNIRNPPRGGSPGGSDGFGLFGLRNQNTERRPEQYHQGRPSHRDSAEEHRITPQKVGHNERPTRQQNRPIQQEFHDADLMSEMLHGDVRVEIGGGSLPTKDLRASGIKSRPRKQKTKRRGSGKKRQKSKRRRNQKRKNQKKVIKKGASEKIRLNERETVRLAEMINTFVDTLPEALQQQAKRLLLEETFGDGIKDEKADENLKELVRKVSITLKNAAKSGDTKQKKPASSKNRRRKLRKRTKQRNKLFRKRPVKSGKASEQIIQSGGKEQIAQSDEKEQFTQSDGKEQRKEEFEDGAGVVKTSSRLKNIILKRYSSIANENDDGLEEKER